MLVIMSAGDSKDKRRTSVTSSPEMTNAIVEIHKNNPSHTESSPSSTSSKRRRDSKTERPRKSSKGEEGQGSDVNVADNLSRVQKVRESWVQSDLNGSAEEELQIHTQIKQGIMGFIENEIKKSDAKNPIATLSAYVNSITESEENLRNIKGSGHREKKSPSRRKKKRISSKHRSDLGSDFDITISSMSALEKVDDYLKEYNKCEEVTLSGELEIETNDLVNNNGYSKESKLKPRRRRKSRHEESKRDKNANTRDVSPRVFDPATGKHIKSVDNNIKPVRPALDLTSVLDDLGSDITSYNERHIDNPFSSPSPMTSPNEVLGAFGSRPDKIYVQKGGTFRAVARDRVLGDGRRTQDKKYFRLSSLTPLDVAITAQSGWRGVATLCHGLLGGLALMHLLAVCYGDATQAGHLTFHASIIVPYSAAYYFLCACCLVSVFDSLDPSGFSHAVNYYPHIRGMCVAVLYGLCMILTLSSRKYDEMMAFQYRMDTNVTHIDTDNSTHTVPVPEFYNIWSHLSVWRALLPIFAAIIVAFIKQDDVLYRELANLTQFKHSLQSIGG